jgi:hypothetical protein
LADQVRAHEAEECTVLEAVARQRLMTQQAEKSLASVVAICEL